MKLIPLPKPLRAIMPYTKDMLRAFRAVVRIPMDIGRARWPRRRGGKVVRGRTLQRYIAE